MTHLDVASYGHEASEDRRIEGSAFRHLREVERGAEVEVTDRDRPIAWIVPVRRVGAPLVVIPPKRRFSSVRGKRRAPAGWKVSSTELLLRERQRR